MAPNQEIKTSTVWDSPGGTVYRSPFASAGCMDSIPSLERPHVLQRN